MKLINPTRSHPAWLCLHLFLAVMAGCAPHPKENLPEAVPAADTLRVPPPPRYSSYDIDSAGVLRVLSLHSINSFFVHDGQPQGLEYEILDRYARHRNLILSVRAVHHYAELYDSIAAGNFDMIMGTLITNASWNSVLPETAPLYTVDLVVVAVDSISAADTVEVIRNSPLAFWTREADSLTWDRPTRFAPYSLSKEQALSMVALHQLPNVLVDRHEFEIMSAYYPDLKIVATPEKDHPVSFSLHPDQEDLRADFNEWLDHWKGHNAEYAWILKKYSDLFDRSKARMRYEKPELIQGKISDYDPLVKNYSDRSNLDWLLVSAVIYQESRFRPNAESPVGARGLMQLMPSVAETYHIDFGKFKEPAKNVEIGTRYLRQLLDRYEKDTLLTPENRIKFALASYNAGPGHIIDARALAKKHKLDPNVWDGHVATMLTQKHLGEFNRDPVVRYGHFRGWETYGYVRNIMMYYADYKSYSAKYF
jgi:membrane-bound lytic murein transglycosylase F